VREKILNGPKSRFSKHSRRAGK